jgi:hypothetical protein
LALCGRPGRAVIVEFTTAMPRPRVFTLIPIPPTVPICTPSTMMSSLLPE